MILCVFYLNFYKKWSQEARSKLDYSRLRQCHTPKNVQLESAPYLSARYLSPICFFSNMKFPTISKRSSKNILRYNSFHGFKMISEKTDLRELFCRIKLNPLKLLYLKMFLVHGCIKDFGNFLLKKTRPKC
jgi:hypothetical protein